MIALGLLLSLLALPTTSSAEDKPAAPPAASNVKLNFDGEVLERFNNAGALDAVNVASAAGRDKDSNLHHKKRNFRPEIKKTLRELRDSP